MVQITFVRYVLEDENVIYSEVYDTTEVITVMDVFINTS